MPHLPDKTNERNHVFHESSKPPCGDYVFKGKSFTLPDMDYDETQLKWFENGLE